MEKLELLRIPRRRDRIIVVDGHLVLVHVDGQWVQNPSVYVPSAMVDQWMTLAEETGHDVYLSALVSAPSLYMRMGLN